ncbi:hypothetical protein [Nocardioides sp.]|uniref:hypothetical protein n=1 Tax=Nocardioides sp. TaxID=35761 RepID=UPI002610A267|nr:hypothetical protein [Nocardioides sp.]
MGGDSDRRCPGAHGWLRRRRGPAGSHRIRGRAGIDAFNAAEYGETVEHFQAALPPAEEQDDGPVPVSELIEAVRYYAELDAKLYPEAARSSPEFAKYQAITLGQCVAGDAGTQEPPSADA